MIGITIGGTNLGAKRRLIESPCKTEATLMTFTLEEEGCAPQAAGKPQSMDANRHPDTNVDFLECLFFRVSFFLEYLIVSIDDTAPLPLPLQGTETSVRRRLLATLRQATTYLYL
jgi:hypothetical protein